jgi:hypothetical protein
MLLSFLQLTVPFSSFSVAPGTPPQQALTPAALGRDALAPIARVLFGGIARPIHALVPPR